MTQGESHSGTGTDTCKKSQEKLKQCVHADLSSQGITLVKNCLVPAVIQTFRDAIVVQMYIKVYSTY